MLGLWWRGGRSHHRAKVLIRNEFPPVPIARYPYCYPHGSLVILPYQRQECTTYLAATATFSVLRAVTQRLLRQPAALLAVKIRRRTPCRAHLKGSYLT